MHPDEVGWKGDAIVLTKVSGRAGLKSRLEHLGYKVADKELLEIFNSFYEFSRSKKRNN